jgi:hypothetical protein
MGSEQRKSPRVSGYAKALLVGPTIPGYIRDLSASGCQVAFMQPVGASMGDLLRIRVISEQSLSIPAFELSLRVRWLKPDPLWFALGGEIEEVSCQEDDGVFKRLVEYYAGTGE